MIVFKVVYKDTRIWTTDRDYISCIVHRSPFTLKYIIGERTSARRDSVGICVFETLQQAQAYHEGTPNWFILRAQTDRRYAKRPNVLCTWLHDHFFDTYYKPRWIMGVPKGTLTVPSIIPLEMIEASQ